jgi:dihydrofolate synthase/folylpolyglutamate synthase
VNFDEAESYLLSLGNEVVAMKLGLENIRKLLGALGHPENNFLKVQVAGTNGKGSVCAFLDSICNTASIPTGTFTSPHLVSITERIRINGRDISKGEFARHATRVRETAESMLASGELEYRPTFFEQITAIALVAFADAGVETAILETGLGGRLDATTAANAEIAAITRIDIDHQEYLGETIEEIAAEKAAIIGEHTLEVVIGAQDRPIMALFRKRCAELGIEPINDEYSPSRVLAGEGDLVNLDLQCLVWPPIRLGLKGRHQLENAQTACQVVRALTCHGIFPAGDEGEPFIVDGLKHAVHPGRLEFHGRYIFDGAHNVGGAAALVAYLDEFEKRPVTMIFGSMRGKNVEEILKILAPIAKRIVLTEPTNARSLSYDELLDCLPDDLTRENVFATDSVANAIDIAETVTSDDEIILVTGSLYLVGEVKKILNNSSNTGGQGAGIL